MIITYGNVESVHPEIAWRGEWCEFVEKIPGSLYVTIHQQVNSRYKPVKSKSRPFQRIYSYNKTTKLNKLCLCVPKFAFDGADELLNGTCNVYLVNIQSLELDPLLCCCCKNNVAFFIRKLSFSLASLLDDISFRCIPYLRFKRHTMCCTFPYIE